MFSLFIIIQAINTLLIDYQIIKEQYFLKVIYTVLSRPIYHQSQSFKEILYLKYKYLAPYLMKCSLYTIVNISDMVLWLEISLNQCLLLPNLNWLSYICQQLKVPEMNREIFAEQVYQKNTILILYTCLLQCITKVIDSNHQDFDVLQQILINLNLWSSKLTTIQLPLDPFIN